MEHYKALFSGRYFTAGRLYPVLDHIEGGGIMTADNDNAEHYLSGDYLLTHFRKATGDELRAAGIKT